MTKVVSIRNHDYTVYVGRSGKGVESEHGNPVVIGSRCPVCSLIHYNGGSTILCYTSYLEKRIKDPAYRASVKALKGETLGCFCMGPMIWNTDMGNQFIKCHGQVLALMAEKLNEE